MGNLKVISLMPLDGIYHPITAIDDESAAYLDSKGIAYDKEPVSANFFTEYKAKAMSRISEALSDFYTAESLKE